MVGLDTIKFEREEDADAVMHAILDSKESPYTSDQQRVANYIAEATDQNVGGGEDPIGFLLASHAYQAGKLAMAVKYLDSEPLPGPMPDNLWQLINGDRAATESAIRSAVRQTKEKIKKHLT